MKKMKLKRFLVSIILIIVTLASFNINMFSCSVHESNSNITDNNKNIEYTDTYKVLKDYDGSIDSIYYCAIDESKLNLQSALVAEVEKYIKGQVPNSNKQLSEYLVKHCLNNNIDICFAMAQTQVETSFGTTGAGRPISRRSLFGVAGRNYSNYEKAIIDYIEILKKSYLTSGRTEQNLMRNYVTTNGTRYASNTKYESHLKSTYDNIRKCTNIYQLQQNYNKI